MKIIEKETSETFQSLASGDCFKVKDNPFLISHIFMKTDSDGHRNTINLTENKLWTTLAEVKVIKLPNAAFTY